MNSNLTEYTNYDSKARFLKYIIVLIIFSSIFCSNVRSITYGSEQYETGVHGTVVTDQNIPLPNARILIYNLLKFSKPTLLAETVTGDDGYFSIEFESNSPECLIYAFYDDTETEGIMNFPAVTKINSSISSHQLSFSLIPASTVYFEGPLRLVDSLSNIIEYEYTVINPETESLIGVNGLWLTFGPIDFSLNDYLPLEDNVLIVPSDTRFSIKVKPRYTLDSIRAADLMAPRSRATGLEQVLHKVVREIIITEGDGFLLSKGETLRLDIRKYTLAKDLEMMDNLVQTLEEKVSVHEENGFYTVAERKDLKKVIESIEIASNYFIYDLLEDAYIESRSAYLSMKDLYSRLLSQEVEASRALIGLILLITLNSIALAYMIFESYSRKIFFSIIVYAFLSLFLYVIHPGRNFVELTNYLTYVIGSILAITAVIILVPKFTRGKIEEGFSLLSVIESLFSMGKRNLLRRKLRFTLTFLSVFILSLSFVALTSASFEYGLIFNSQNWAISTTQGLMIKGIPYNPESPVLKGHFNELSDDTINWVNGIDAVVTASRKAETLPSLESYGYIGGQPIHGILGLDTSTEQTVKEIEASLIEGSLPREGSNEVTVSDQALLSGRKTLGETIFLEGFSLEIVGVFGKEIMHVREINGELLVPNTQINVNQDMSAPIIAVVPCEYESVIITDVDMALEIDEDVRLSRISLTVKDDIDKITLSKSLALERGLRVWASTGSEVYLAKIGDQFVGKGTLLIVPYTIVILNVVVTILTSFYERRREVNILSSVGLSPSHIAGILVAESSIIGILGGAFGHLAGLSIYPVLSLFTSAPLARQKISAIWSLGTIGIALAAASISALFSLKWSVNITPSLTRRWSVNESPGYYTEPWVIPIPAKVSQADFNEFAGFITNQLMAYSNRQSFPNITSFRGDLMAFQDGKSSLSFWYREGETGVGGASVKCSLITTKFDSNYKLELICFGSQVEIYKAGNFIRHIIMRWNVRQ